MISDYVNCRLPVADPLRFLLAAQGAAVARDGEDVLKALGIPGEEGAAR